MNGSVLLTGLLLAAALPQAAIAASEAPVTFRRLALAIGSNQGGADREVLLYAATDARTFVTVLREMGGVAPNDARLLENPSPGELDAAFRTLSRQVAGIPRDQGRTEVVVYYSGHADETGLLLGEQSYPYDRFRSQIDSIQADVRIAVLDACASGAITRLKGGRRRPAFLVDASSDTHGYAFLTSSSPFESSQESDRIHSSFFTHYLVSGLRGAADVSGDGKVTLGEAYQFAFHETLARTERTKAGPQHPAYDMKLSGTGDVVMTDTRQTSAGLILGKELEGRFFVRGQDGQLVAELYKPTGRAVELGLAPGTYRIDLEQRKILSTSALALTEGARSELSARDFVPVHPETATLRGGAGSAASATGAGSPPETGRSDRPMTVELGDQIDVPMGPDTPYTLSLGFFFTHRSQPFHGLQLSLLYNQATTSLLGGQAAVLANLVRGPITGFQAAALGNVALASIQGVQAASLFNVSRAGGKGLQIASVLNLSGPLQGVQCAAVANVNRGRVRGGQWATVMNCAREIEGGQGAAVMNLSGPVTGIQGSAVLNVAVGPVKGVQAAGVCNLARSVAGPQVAGVLNLAAGDVSRVQVAGVANIARNVDGPQIASVLNVARDVDGMQIGLVNVSRDVRNGFPIGLFSYSQTGLHSLNLWSDEMGYQNAAVLSGSRSVYTYLSVGKKHTADRTSLGFGLGYQRPYGEWFGSADLGVVDFLENWHFETDDHGNTPQLYRLRLQAGREIYPHLSLFGGASGNYYWNRSGKVANLPWGHYQAQPSHHQYAWPGLFLGLRLGC